MMHFLKKEQIRPSVLSLLCGLYVALFSALFALQAAAQAITPDIQVSKVARADKGIFIFADIKFDLPSSIEDAMYKGVSLTFVCDAEIMRERWYWFDKAIAVSHRQARISYQALTRRWRVLPWSDADGASGLGVQMAQAYETLPEALAAVQRIYGWRLAVEGDVSNGAYVVSLNYRLDTSQLPRPLQIGLLGQGDWSIGATTRQRVQLTDNGS